MIFPTKQELAVRVKHISNKGLLAIQLFVQILFRWMEGLIVPLLLVASFVLIGTVIWRSISWFALAATITSPDHASIRIQAENEIMRTLAQVLAGAFVLTGLFYTAKSVLIARRGNITDRFGLALKDLGDSENLMKRIGGIHSLETIAKDSPRDHWQIMEILCDFVRESTNEESYIQAIEVLPVEKRSPRADIQQILEVLGRRNRPIRTKKRRLDLSNCKLAGANLIGVNFEGVNFKNADLQRALMQKAKLTDAEFGDAKLYGANLSLSDLTQANFYRADLGSSRIRGCILIKTSFARATLQFAEFDGSSLFDVIFQNSILDNAVFSNASLLRCDFRKASLNGTTFVKERVKNSLNLLSEQINEVKWR